MRDTALATPVSDMQTKTGLSLAYWRSDRRYEGAAFATGIGLLSYGIGTNSVLMGLQYADVAAHLFQYHYPDNADPWIGLTDSVKSAAMLTGLQAGMTVSRHLMSTNLHRKWAGWLRAQFVDAMLNAHNSAYHIKSTMVSDDKGKEHSLEYVDQRVTECIKDSTGAQIGLAMGVVTATSTLSAAVQEAFRISQPFDAPQFMGRAGAALSDYMGASGTAVMTLATATLSVAVGTTLAYLIGRQITKVNAAMQETEAGYRNNINNLSRTAFYVAASAGKYVEEKLHKKFYKAVDNAWWKHNSVHAGFMGYSKLYNPFSTHIVSYLPALGNYVAGSMNLNTFLKTSSTAASVINSMEWFIDVMPALANLKTNLTRASDVAKSIDAVSDSHAYYQKTGISEFRYVSQSPEMGLYVQGLELMHAGHDAPPFLKARRVLLRPGDWAQISGPNGAGKSCFMKAIADRKYLWPYGRGTVASSEDLKWFYATQDTEFQPVTLKQLVTYQKDAAQYDDAAIETLLDTVGLEKFKPYLHKTGDDKGTWNFSGGEKQKLILARILLADPDILLLDEANSAMDVEAKAQFYSLLSGHLRGRPYKQDSIVIAVVHEEKTPRDDKGEPYFNKVLQIEDGVMVQKANVPETGRKHYAGGIAPTYSIHHSSGWPSGYMSPNIHLGPSLH